MLSKVLEKLHLSKTKKRVYKVTYDKKRNRYFIIYESYPYHLNEGEVIFDENMTFDEASKYSHDLNTEIGLTIHYGEEE
jgi:hypothetical protein